MEDWKIANKVVNMKRAELESLYKYMGNDFAASFSREELVQSLFNNYTPSELEKHLRKWEDWSQKRRDVAVGEIVVISDKTKGVVLDIEGEEEYWVFTENACVERWKDVEKTGVTADVSGLLRQVRDVCLEEKER